MSEAIDPELRQRLELIERLVAEGRQGCEYYGWVFLLWGVGHAAAMAWSTVLPVAQKPLPWSILMPACAALMLVISWRKRRGRRVRTVVGRAVGMVWLAAAPTFFLVGGLMPQAGSSDLRALAAFFLLIGVPNLASGLILRWPVQVAVGLLWWAAALVSMHWPTPEVIMACFAAMILIGEIGFGIYLMAMERRDAARG